MPHGVLEYSLICPNINENPFYDENQDFAPVILVVLSSAENLCDTWNS